MKFKNASQRKAVMAKLRKGATILYSYERKRNDVNGNPRHFAHNISVIKKSGVVHLIDKIDIGYRDPSQAVFEELQRKGAIPKTKEIVPKISQAEKDKLRKVYQDKSKDIITRRKALHKHVGSGRTNYVDLKRSYKFRQI